MSEDATLEEFVDAKETKQWRTVKLGQVSRKRSDNVDPKKVELDRHVGLEHIGANTPYPDWESVEDLSSTKRRFKPGDILFAKLRPNLEKAAQPEFEGISSTDIFPIVAEQGINSKYLLYRLSSKPAFDHARRTSVGTRMPRTSWNLFCNFEFGLPPLEEQRKIASVLYTVDQAIQKTREIKRRVERLEKGVIKTLLSKGVHYSDGTKQTPIGEIPTSWNVEQVGNITGVTVGYVQDIEGHFTDSEHGIPLYRTKDISSRGLQVQEKAYVTPDFHENNQGSQLRPGDLIVARHGESGQAAVVPKSTPEAHCQNVVIVRSSDKFVSKFLEYLFNYDETRQRLLAWKAGSVQKVVSTTAVQNFRIPLPPIDEQREIVEKLSAVNERLENEDSYFSVLKKLKQGLMQDLLSGEVRTHDKNIKVVDDVLQFG